MKKIVILLAITVFSIQLFSQKDNSRYYNSWRLGLNLGGAWQTADYKSRWGGAGGLTLEKGFHENATNIFSFAIRARYLGANTYGMDYNRNYDIKDNYAYNGTYNPSVNYVDSVSLNRRYVYDNYKMTLSEGALELQLSFNRLRERTGVILNLWGGVGVTSYRTKSDLLDGNGKRYNFSKIDSTGNQSKALNNYSTLIDKKYESYALGSKSGNLVTFSPSAGIGLGYQFTPGFSMLWEYKVTFPQGSNADLLDGRYGNNKDMIAGNNDYYHYTGLNLLFTLRGKHKTKTVKDETVYTNTTVTTNSLVAPPTNTVAPINTNTTVVTSPQPTGQKPAITFVTPPSNGYVVNNSQYQISAKVLHVDYANQIQFKFNGVNATNFNFNTQSKILTYNATLLQGNNSVQIIAKNSVGIDDKLTSVFYELPKAPVSNPPVITIFNPASCPYAAATQNFTFTAYIKNITSQNNLVVKLNNVSVSTYSFNTVNGQLDLPIDLISGNNEVSVSATNKDGSDTKNCTISFVKKTVSAPQVTIVYPAQNGFVAAVPNFNAKAQVLNVPSKDNISVFQNNNPVSFTYDATTHQVSIPLLLTSGSNLLSVQASSKGGADSKTTTIVYQERKIPVKLPVVDLISPELPANASDALFYQFKLSVLNVASKNNIDVVFNNNVFTNFIYDSISKQISFSNNLTPGNNTIIVKGTNTAGSDSKTITINYTPKAVVKNPPVITIVAPQVSPSTETNPIYLFKATVTNISNKSGLIVKFNGNVLARYAFDGTNISYSAPLQNGSNSFEITATNTDGSDSKTSVVNYKTKIVVLPPIVNLINPASQENASDAAYYIFKLSVLNVNSNADITVTHNNSSVPNFTYNTTTKEVDFSLNLAQGQNTIIVKGTNTAGSDSKTISINYTPKAVVKNPPVITMVAPQASPSTESNPIYLFKATVTNISNKSGLIVKFNGNVLARYAFDGTNISYSAPLQNGSNSFEITATNTDGSDSKTSVVNYKPKIVVLPPVVNLINPASQENASDAAYYIFKLSVLNVNSNADITVTHNNSSVPNFTYNTTTKEVDFSLNLVQGQNTIIVKGTNTAGSDSKQININYTPHVELKTPPVITISNPARGTAIVQTPAYTFKANISNVPTTSGLAVKFNGTQITDYTYNGSELVYLTNLQIGDNVLEITTTNNDGSDTKNATVNYKQRVVPKPPVVVISTPVNTPTVETASYNFTFKAYNVSQSQLEVKLNEQIISTFSFVNFSGSFTNNLVEGVNTLSVKATNTDGSVTKTAAVVFKPIVTSTTTPVDTTHQTNGGRVMKICHIPPGNEQNPQTITIPEAAWPAHAAHGDLPNACPNKPTNIIVNPNKPKGSTGVGTIDTLQNKIENNNQLIRPR